MTAGCLSAGVSVLAFVLVLVVVFVEEASLRDLQDYREYCEIVRWRLVPGVL